MKIAKHLKNAASGFIIGSSMLLPGISGGTTAIMLGIYDRLISAVNGVFKQPLKNLLFLGEVCIGGAAGALLLARWLLLLSDKFYYPMHILFAALIAASIPLLIKKSEITMKNIYCIVFAVIGAGIAISVMLLPSGSVSDSAGIGQTAKLMISGMLISIALILPGISTSHILLTLGIYESVLSAVTKPDIPYLAFLCTGIVAGIFLFTKILDIAMNRYPAQVYMLIAGFVIASIYVIFPD